MRELQNVDGLNSYQGLGRSVHIRNENGLLQESELCLAGKKEQVTTLKLIKRIMKCGLGSIKSSSQTNQSFVLVLLSFRVKIFFHSKKALGMLFPTISPKINH